MKKIYYAMLCLLSLFVWQACADDKGNYSYRELNDLGISFNDAYTAIARDPFTVKPQVSAKNFNPADYTYEWKAYDQSGQQETVVLGTDLNLDVTLGLTQGSYLLVLNITEKATGIYYQHSATLKVNTPTSEGWLLLCSDGGRVQLDMVSHIKTVDNVYHDLLKGTELENWQDPRQLVCDPNMEEPFYLVTGSGTTRLGSNDFQWNDSYMLANEFGTGIYEGTVSRLATHFPGKLFVDAAGNVYYCCTLMGDGLFGSVRSNGFYVAPQVGYNAKATQVVPSFMMWDKGGRRFVMCANQFYSLGIDDSQDIPMDEMAADGFPTVNEGLFAWPKRADRLDLIHMENTRYDRNQDDNGVTYAVLGKGNDRWLYGIILGNLYSFVEPKYGPAYEKTCYVSLSGCTDIAKADHYAFSSLKNFMYYSVGRSVYRVNLDATSPTAELQFELPAGEEITCMKFYLWEQDDPDNRSYDLIVASKKSDTNEGILRIYDGFKNEGSFLNAEPVEQYGGFADIVDVIYRENIVYRP